jgi:predicted nucleotidyltransferase
MDSNIKAQQIADLIREEFSKSKVPIERVLLFGSHANNTETKNSDWDFFVLTKQKIERQQKMSLIFQSKKSIVSKYHEPTDILVRAHEELDEIQNDPACVSYYALKEGRDV